MGSERSVVSYYLALMTSVCLEAIGAQGPAVVEGPFAGNGAYCEMLEAATGRPVVRASAGTGTSAGASLLVATERNATLGLSDDRQTALGAPELHDYAERWLGLCVAPA